MTQEDEMRIGTAVIGLLALAALAGCSSPTYGGGGGGGAGGGGGGGGPSSGTLVGNHIPKSAHNGSDNPATDTVAVGGTVTHSGRSQGAPSFPSSPIETGDGKTYSVTFTTPGSYSYDCAVHGAAMSGTIVVR